MTRQHMRDGLIRTFRSPGAEFRGKPFWAWNGKLEEGELRRQIRLMRRMGLGGFFMHARTGLATPYLSDEWFRLVNACVHEARQQGLEAWLYDEDRWPSGVAGGMVTRGGKHRQQFLRMEPVRSYRWTSDVFAVFAAAIRGKTAWNVRPIARGTRLPKLGNDETFLVFRVVPGLVYDSKNGAAYLDTLSHAAVRRFIAITHEAYARHCGRHFGTVIPGIFTDEPHHGGMFYDEGGSLGAPEGASQISWTPRLPSAFRRRHGYDLLPHLVEIFFDVDGIEVTPARYHYHECVAHLIVDAYARQIGEWCERHHLRFTGHPMASHAFAIQAQSLGSTMRFYEYMQAPGLDLLTEHSRTYSGAKQVSSVARQFGRRWRLTETTGCTGWDFSFAGHKALGDWQAALGINLRCQHLALYTMEGEAKRDFPASISYQSPWWSLYAKVEDYFARIHAVMTRGAEVRDILVIHPIESVWLFLKRKWFDDMERANRAERRFTDLCDTLLQAHLDFDYGDEDIMARHAGVRRTEGRPLLQVGQAGYRAMVVPPMTTLRASTLRLLQTFAAAGGQIVWAGAPAACVDAVSSDEPRQLAARCRRAPAKGPALAAAVEAACGRRVSITDAAGVEIPSALYLLREDAAAFYFFICNTGHSVRQLRGMHGMYDPTKVRDRTAAFDPVMVRGFGECAGAPLELDAESGEIFAARAARKAAGWEIQTSLPALGSRLFVIPKSKSRQAYPRRPVFREVSRRAIGGREWEIALSDFNPLALDRPRSRIGGKPWRAAEEILRVDAAVREAAGLPRRSGDMVQPWARKPIPGARPVAVELAYFFEIACLPEQPVFLALEQPRRYRIILNGLPVPAEVEEGWWVDTSLRKIPLPPGVLRLGRNELVLACDYDEAHPGLETAYLLGSFGVHVSGLDTRLVALPAKLRLGDWVPQGLPFYSGAVRYRTTIMPKLRRGERLFVSVSRYRGVAARIHVNGLAIGVIAWDPPEVDITKYVTGQALDLCVEVIGHRRNSHGPLHFYQKWPLCTGPGEFTSTGRQWVERYQLVPCGLMGSPQLAIRKELKKGKEVTT